jgi:hypothetical protein
MTRGPQPLKAQDESMPIAEKRGLVMRYQHRRGNVCDFSIMSPGLVSFICAMRLIRLSSTPEDILHDFSSMIGQLRFIASSPAISRELWLRTPRGAWRFFRICDDSILELGQDGMPLVNGTGPAALPAICTGLIKKPEPSWPNGKKTVTASQPSAGKNSAPDIPTKNPGQTENSAPDLNLAQEPEPEKDLKPAAIPEKISEPVKDPGPAQDLISEPELEKIPEPIKKFLRRREKGLENDPEPD